MSTETAVPEIRWLEERTSRWDDLVMLASDQGVRVTPETAMKTSVWFACARVVAETVASLPLHLYRRIDDERVERAKNLPLYRVLAKRPNSWQTRYEWVETMCLHLGFYGSAYNLKVPGAAGSVTELHPLHPSGMEVKQEDDKTLTYLYREPGTGRQVVYRDDQIMHVRWLSFDGVNGAVPIDLGKDAISLARSLEQYAATFYRNNAQPGIVLHTDQALPREVREQLREQWNNRHRGASRAGETAILSNGLKADTISATNQESQLAELWMQALLAVCRIWKMPPHMVQELGRATWGNLASEMVSFEKFTIQPWLRRIEGAIERDIIGDDDDLYAEFLVEGLLRSDITTRYQAYEIAIRNGWMQPEEVRQKENLGPMPEGEESEAPAATPPAPPTPEPEDESDDEEDDQEQQRNCGIGQGGFQPGNSCGKGGGGGGGGDSGGSSDGGGSDGAGGSGGSDGGPSSSPQTDTPKQKQRRERLRDRIEGTQAEADLEVKKAQRKTRDLEKKLNDVKQQIAGLESKQRAVEEAYRKGIERAKAEKERKIADSQARLAKRLEEIRAKYKRSIDAELDELETGANEVEAMLRDLAAAVSELDAVEKDLEAFSKRLKNES